MEMTWNISDQNQYSKKGKELLKILFSNQIRIIALQGDLGAGKTTFTQYLASELGITEPVVSPTFGIMKAYELEGNQEYDVLVHIDAYRIEDESEIGPLRFTELFSQPRTLVVVEWPDNIASVLPSHRAELTFSIIGETERQVTITLSEEQ